MSTMQKPKQRISFTDLERQKLRFYQKSHPSLAPRQLASWFESEFRRKISNSSVYDILSDKYAYLDNVEASDTSRRNRSPQWVELEDALFKWWQEVQPCDVTGKELKRKANKIWQTFPAYHTKKTPSFSDGWLTSWRARHGLGQYTRSIDFEDARYTAGKQEVPSALVATIHESTTPENPQPHMLCAPQRVIPQFPNCEVSYFASSFSPPVEQTLNIPQMSFLSSVNQNTYHGQFNGTLPTTGRRSPGIFSSDKSKKSSRNRETPKKHDRYRVKRSKLTSSNQPDVANAQACIPNVEFGKASTQFNKTMWNSIQELHLQCNAQVGQDLVMTGNAVINVFEPVLSLSEFSPRECFNTLIQKWENVAVFNARKAVCLLMASEAFKIRRYRDEPQRIIYEDWFLDFISDEFVRSPSLDIAAIEGLPSSPRSSNDYLSIQRPRNLPCKTSVFSTIVKNGRVTIWTRAYASKDSPNTEQGTGQFQATIVITPPANVHPVPETIIQLQTQTKLTSILSTPIISFRTIIPEFSEIFRVAQYGTSSQLQIMLSMGEASLFVCDPEGRSLINYALMTRNSSTLKFLITKVEDIDAYEVQYGESIMPLIGLLLDLDAIHDILERDERLVCLKMMLHAGADPSLNSKSGRGITVFEDELCHGSFEAAKALLDIGQPFVGLSTDIRIRFEDDLTPLLYLSRRYATPNENYLQLHEKIFLLLERGADARARSASEDTCLHIVLRFHLDMEKYKFSTYQEQEFKDILMSMVTSGADVFASGGCEWTVSQVACMYGHEELWREVLAECGYDPDEVFCLENDFESNRYGNSEYFLGAGVFPAIASHVRSKKLSFKEYDQRRKLLECVQNVYYPTDQDIDKMHRESDEFWESIDDSTDNEDDEGLSVEKKVEGEEDEHEEERERMLIEKLAMQTRMLAKMVRMHVKNVRMQAKKARILQKETIKF